MDEVTATLPLFRFGHAVGEMTIHCRANWDEALGGLTADIFFEDHSLKRHPVPENEVKPVLDEIRDHDPAAWREIIERAKADDLEGCAAYEPHWAENELEEFACPR